MLSVFEITAQISECVQMQFGFNSQEFHSRLRSYSNSDEPPKPVMVYYSNYRRKDWANHIAHVSLLKIEHTSCYHITAFDTRFGMQFNHSMPTAIVIAKELHVDCFLQHALGRPGTCVNATMITS